MHIKCVVGSDARAALVSLAAASGWHPSRNPFAALQDDRIVQFVNRRFYGAARLEAIDAAVDELVPKLLGVASIAEIKYEVAVYDSNAGQDRWWAG